MTDDAAPAIPVSVLSATHDGERADRLDLCLASMARQTLRPEQVVLVLDGRLRRELHDVVDAWRERLPLEVHRRERAGIAPSLNHGLERCRNALVIRCDTDDVNRPERFRRQAGFLSTGDAAVCSGPIREFASDGRTAIRRVPLGRVGPNSLRGFFRNPVNHNSSAFRRDAVLGVGGYPADPPGHVEDYRLWLRLLRAGHAVVNHADILLDACVDDRVARRTGAGCRAGEYALWRENARRLGGLGVFPATVALAMRLPFRWSAGAGALGWMYRRVLR